MESSNPKLGSLIEQLHNRTNKLKETCDQALVELERQKAENEKRYQEQLEQIKEARRKWDEEKAIMEKLAPSTNSIVNLNVGGEKMETSKATLTLIEGSLLAIMFSGKWEDKLIKDKNGCIFLDYDPVVSRNFACI
jgi:predicted RNase H-like nuclease (RuvC/YqgF family)